MKTVYISDIHQDLSTFNKIVSHEWPEDTVFVCLGDYVDTFGPKATEEEVEQAKARYYEDIKTKCPSEYYEDIIESYEENGSLDDKFMRAFSSYEYYRPDGLIQVGNEFYKGNKVWYEDPYHNPVNVIDRVVLWKKADPEHRKLLIGNHDYSYLPEADSCVSGHQEHWSEIRAAFEYYRDQFDIAYSDEYSIATHAGITSFLTDCLMNLKEGRQDNVANTLNHLFHTDRQFSFDHCGLNSYGDDPVERCLWVRPNSLIAYNPFRYGKTDFCKPLIQVVGHTELDKATLFTYEGGKPVAICDTRDHDQFVVVEDGEVSFYTFDDQCNLIKLETSTHLVAQEVLDKVKEKVEASFKKNFFAFL